MTNNSFALTDGLAIHLRIGSAEFRYVGEYRPGKHGPVAVMGNGGLPAIIFSDPYIMVIIPFVAEIKSRGVQYIIDNGRLDNTITIMFMMSVRLCRWVMVIFRNPYATVTLSSITGHCRKLPGNR